MMKLILLLALLPATASAQGFVLDSTEVRLLIRDSDNAHEVAKAALGAVACILESISGNAEWTPQECGEKLEVILKDYGQEHMILHPMVFRMLQAKLNSQ